MDRVPSIRVRALNNVPADAGRDVVLYWMVANRRSRYNFSLDRALEYARDFNKPLLVLEPLRVGYRWASDRLHHFVIQGMVDNEAAFTQAGVSYFPYVEPAQNKGKGLLEALAQRACVVVTDDYPAFFVPAMLATAASKLARVGTRLEAIDSNGLFPMHATDRVFARAVDFRRYLQKNLSPHLAHKPRAQLRRAPAPYTVPSAIAKRWPRADLATLENPAALSSFPIDHSVAPASLRGGEAAGRERLKGFIKKTLRNYGEGRNHPDEEASSGLSPYLHFGHVSAHEVFWTLASQEGWALGHEGKKATGSREGWWNMGPAAESFLDELITWRELGLNMCAHRDDYDQYTSLPDWAQKTLAEHASDPRPVIYDLETLEQARTGDPIWNAAQRQLVSEGIVHNYLRMLWGKKILEWSTTPQRALDVMEHLNNKYALDGRDPNSYSGIFWVLGRYDRAWGPERPIYGKIRYMTSESTQRKLRLKNYLDRYGPQSQGTLFAS